MSTPPQKKCRANNAKRTYRHPNGSLHLNHCPPYFLILYYMVPKIGLEPIRLSPPPPQDGVSTNFTTSANLTLLMSP